MLYSRKINYAANTLSLQQPFVGIRVNLLDIDKSQNKK